MNTNTHDAPVLVLANSLSATQEMWRHLIPIWSKSHRVLCYNYAGHGQATEATLSPHDSIQGMGQDLIARLDEKGVEQFDFVGLSLGGMLGLHLAASHPQRVRHLVAANCRYYNGEEGRQQWDQRIHTVNENGITAICEGTLQRWFTPAFQERNPDMLKQMEAMIMGTSRQGYALAATAVRNLDLRPQLADIQCPVLLLTGDQDVAAPASHMQELEQQLPHAQLHVFEQCAHISCIEHPQAFSDQVRRHLAC